MVNSGSMNRFGRFGISVLSVLVVLPMCVAAQADPRAAEVEAREIAFAQSMADRDFEAFLTFISPEAIFLNGDQALRGRDAVAEVWRGYFEGEAAPFSWRPDAVEVLESGGLAFTSGPVLNPAGVEVGRFDSVWRMDANGVWRVVFDRGS